MPSTTGDVRIVAIPAVATITADDDLADCLLSALERARLSPASGDVVVVASKVVALTEGAVATPPNRRPEHVLHADDRRRATAATVAERIVADDPRALVVATHHGFVCANAGIDASNVTDGLLALPADPDASARRLRTAVADRLGIDVGVVVSDTFGRAWRMGQTDVALGVAGTAAVHDQRGSHDLLGRRLDVTVVAVADEVAAAADLVRTKDNRVPFVVVRGVADHPVGSGADLVRPLDEDLFPAGGPTLYDHAVTTSRPGSSEPTVRVGNELSALLHHVATTATRPGCHVAVGDGPPPRIEVSADTPVRAGMAAEAVRIMLAGRHLTARVTGTGSQHDPVVVRPIVGPDTLADPSGPPPG